LEQNQLYPKIYFIHATCVKIYATGIKSQLLRRRNLQSTAGKTVRRISRQNENALPYRLVSVVAVLGASVVDETVGDNAVVVAVGESTVVDETAGDNAVVVAVGESAVVDETAGDNVVVVAVGVSTAVDKTVGDTVVVVVKVGDTVVVVVKVGDTVVVVVKVGDTVVVVVKVGDTVVVAVGDNVDVAVLVGSIVVVVVKVGDTAVVVATPVSAFDVDTVNVLVAGVKTIESGLLSNVTADRSGTFSCDPATISWLAVDPPVFATPNDPNISPTPAESWRVTARLPPAILLGATGGSGGVPADGGLAPPGGGAGGAPAAGAPATALPGPATSSLPPAGREFSPESDCGPDCGPDCGIVTVICCCTCCTRRSGVCMAGPGAPPGDTNTPYPARKTSVVPAELLTVRPPAFRSPSLLAPGPSRPINCVPGDFGSSVTKSAVPRTPMVAVFVLITTFSGFARAMLPEI